MKKLRFNPAKKYISIIGDDGAVVDRIKAAYLQNCSQFGQMLSLIAASFYLLSEDGEPTSLLKGDLIVFDQKKRGVSFLRNGHALLPEGEMPAVFITTAPYFFEVAHLIAKLHKLSACKTDKPFVCELK